MAEDLIVWYSSEFDFVDIDEAFCTSSSMMPQKKNADVLEIIRGKCGRVIGNLIGLLNVMKGLPMSYNRDLQEDKESLFEIIDVLLATLELFKDIVDTVIVKDRIMYDAAQKNFILATDMADYLAKKGVPFRKAHTIVSNIVKYAQDHRKSFQRIKLEEYRKFSKYFDSDVYEITIESSIKSRNVPGGTAKNQVKRSLATALKNLESYRNKYR
jgi:argininosuccinate lyase